MATLTCGSEARDDIPRHTRHISVISLRFGSRANGDFAHPPL
jgi:hypothetical protein